MLKPPQPYRPPLLHHGGHMQTIVAAKCSHASFPAWQRERWEWREDGLDDDFCDTDWLHQTSPKAPILVMFHGLEGSSQSHYARSVGAYFQAQGWRVAVPHFRGCSGEPNRLLRAYHSGDALEIEHILRRVRREFAGAPLHAAGVSLGGNALLCYAANPASDIALLAAASVCAPLDLARCGQAITTGFANVYTWSFMQTLRAKSLEKRSKFPNDCDWQAVLASRNLAQFDDAFTAPVHGYRNAADYYERASAKPKLAHITLPTLLLNAQNDPFVPRDVIATLNVSPSVRVEQPAQGGHVGFATAGGWGLGTLNWLPERLHQWFAQGL